MITYVLVLILVSTSTFKAAYSLNENDVRVTQEVCSSVKQFPLDDVSVRAIINNYKHLGLKQREFFDKFLVSIKQYERGQDTEIDLAKAYELCISTFNPTKLSVKREKLSDQNTTSNKDEINVEDEDNSNYKANKIPFSAREVFITLQESPTLEESNFDTNDTKNSIDLDFMSLEKEMQKERARETHYCQYVVTDKLSYTPCICSNITMSLIVPYKTKDENISIVELLVPSNVIATGSCEDNNTYITFSWEIQVENSNKTKAVVSSYSITMHFMKNNSHVFVDSIFISLMDLDKDNFPDAADSNVENSNDALKLFAGSINNGIRVFNASMEIPVGNIIFIIEDVTLFVLNKPQPSKNGKGDILKPNVLLIVLGVTGILVIITLIVCLFYCAVCKKRCQ